MIADLVDVLIAELKDYYDGSGVVVEDYPDDPEKYVLRSQAAVLVVYAGMGVTAPDGAEVIRQVGDPQFRIVTASRNKRTHTGCYDILDAIRAEVLGLEYRNQRFYQVEEVPLESDQGVWLYSQTFAIRQRMRQVGS